MTECGWILLNMAEYGRTWLNMAEYDLIMADDCWIWLYITEYGCILLNIAEYGRLWQNVAKYIWLNTAEYGCIWLNIANRKISRVIAPYGQQLRIWLFSVGQSAESVTTAKSCTKSFMLLAAVHSIQYYLQAVSMTSLVNIHNKKYKNQAMNHQSESLAHSNLR
jgi:hypothetical protein